MKFRFYIFEDLLILILHEFYFKREAQTTSNAKFQTRSLSNFSTQRVVGIRLSSPLASARKLPVIPHAIQHVHEQATNNHHQHQSTRLLFCAKTEKNHLAHEKCTFICCKFKIFFVPLHAISNFCIPWN